MSLWQTLLDSRKWKLCVGAVAVALFGETVGLDVEQVENSVTALVGLVIGQGLADSAKPKATP